MARVAVFAEPALRRRLKEAPGGRLRYEFFPDGSPAVIAPYVGVEWEQAFGQTADYLEADGEDSSGVRFVAGVRLWF